jgi:RNA polymerase sigma factor (sigma-70 family)
MSFLTTHMNRCIDGWRAGDRDAADELVRRAQHRVRHLAEKMYRGFPNVRVVGEADDVLNSGWVRLLHSLKKIRPSNTDQFFLLAGLHIRRELYDMARKANRETYKPRSLEAVAVGGGSSGFTVAQPADGTEDLEMWEHFHESVEKLRAPLQAVVILHFYDDRPFVEIARILRRNEKTIRRWWELACYEIRAYVRGQPGPERPGRPD